MISIIIPAYNEKQSIGRLVNEVMDLPIEKEIIVIDDGSTDGTSKIIKEQIPSCVKKIYFERNRGKGASVKTGIAHSTGEYIVIQDADLEVSPKELLKILEKAEKEKAQVVYGFRFLDKRNRFYLLMLVGNRLITWCTNILFFSELTDVETPAKLFRREAISDICLDAQGFEFEVEVTAKLLNAEYRIIEVPISYRPRNKREGKKIRLIDGLIAIITLLKYRIIK